MKSIVKVGTAVFVWRDGKFLMQKRKGSHGAGTWSVMGGHLELGESFEDCVKREAMEETGMEITNIRFLAVTNDVLKDDRKHYVTVWMEADWLAGEPKITEPEKCTEQVWADFHNLPAPLLEPCYQNLRAVKPELFG